MSDTFFTTSPHWGVYIALYFFVGGIAGGSFFLAALLKLLGRPEDGPTVRAGYYTALAGALLSGVLLTLDLGKPLRFWHMLLQSNRGVPLLKPWSPMSVGAWALLGFIGVSLLASLGALAEQRPTWRRAARLGESGLGRLLAVLGGLLGLFLAGYTGVVLAVSNRPIWADSTWLGAVFLASGISTATAMLLLFRPAAATEQWLSGLDRKVMLLELVTLLAFLISLGSVARLWLSLRGALLLFGVVGAGIVAPLVLEGRAGGRAVGRSDGQATQRPKWIAAGLVLLGGLLLRFVVITAANQPVIHASGAAGLELFQANRDRIDLVILDMVMPGLSGLDVASELERQKPGVKILYISSHGASIAMESLLKQSAERVLLKPFTEQSLVERLAHLLGSADASSEPSGCQSGN